MKKLTPLEASVEAFELMMNAQAAFSVEQARAALKAVRDEQEKLRCASRREPSKAE